MERHELLGIEEAAAYLGIKRSTLYGWVHYRKIPFIKIGRLVKFRSETLKQWVEEREVRGLDFKRFNDPQDSY